ncbi:MAG: c-type cytochrome [Bryobacteraceae bacterium]
MAFFAGLLLRAIPMITVAVTMAPAQIVKPRNPLPEGPEVVSAGRDLYNKSCTMCHGRDGNEGDRAPSLNANRRYFRLSEAAIFDAVKKGIPGTDMPSSDLPELDIWRIVAFIRNIRGTASDNIVPGDIENGTVVFNGKGGCIGCHMIRGQGGTLGPDLSSIGAQVTLQKLQDALTKAGPVPFGYRPVVVTTLKGEVVRGVARNEDAFSIQVLDEKNKLHLFARQELRSTVHPRESLMPHNYDKVLSSTQFRDLVAMLSRQARNKIKIEQPGENEIGR